MVDMVFKYSRSGVSYLRVCLIHLQAYTFSYAVGVSVFLPTLSPHSTIRLFILNVDDMIPKRTHLGSTNHISQSAQRIGRLSSVFTFCVRWRVWPYLREYVLSWLQCDINLPGRSSSGCKLQSTGYLPPFPSLLT